MTIYLGGSGADIFQGTGLVEQSSTISGVKTQLYSASPNPPYKASMLDSSGNSISLSSFWANVYFNATNAAGNAVYPDGIVFLASDGSAIYIDTPNWTSGYFNVYTRNASGTTATIGSQFYYNSANDVKLDIHITGLGTSSGTVDIYVNLVKAYSYTGSLSAVSPVSTFEISCFSGSLPTTLYSVIISDQNTMSAYISKQLPSTAGSHQDWSGTFSNLATVPFNTSTALSASAVGATETAMASAVSIDATKYTIAAVILSSIIINTTTSMSTSHVAIFSGTTYNYSLPFITGQSPQYTILNTAPDGTPWTSDKVSQLEYGITTVAHTS